MIDKLIFDTEILLDGLRYMREKKIMFSYTHGMKLLQLIGEAGKLVHRNIDIEEKQERR